jgi:hypothetical protein
LKKKYFITLGSSNLVWIVLSSLVFGSTNNLTNAVRNNFHHCIISAHFIRAFLQPYVSSNTFK